MGRLSINCACIVIVVCMASTAFAIGYRLDRLETGNPGGPDTSLQTYDNEILLNVGQEVDIDFWVNDVPETLLVAGFSLTFDPAVISVMSISVYENGSAVTAGPWDPDMTAIIPNAEGPGTYFVVCGNLGCVPVGLGGDIIMARVRVRCEAAMNSLLEVATFSSYDTVIGCSSTDFDPQIAPSYLSLTIDICEGNFDGDLDQDGSDAFIFKVDFGRSIILHPCTNGDTCNGDFSCDGDVDGTDAFQFKSDFGRSAIQNPCPICVSSGPWCIY